MPLSPEEKQFLIECIRVTFNTGIKGDVEAVGQTAAMAARLIRLLSEPEKAEPKGNG